jgi:AcrR family transcriptional regulator
LFVSAAKPHHRRRARALRRDEGLPIRRIAARLGVSAASVHAWTRDIEISAEHRTRNLAAAREAAGRRWAETNRENRRRYQNEGRARAGRGEALHEAGCMLYWAEGAKDRGVLTFANSDRAMVSFFWRFLNTYFEVEAPRVRVRLNVYLNNGLSLPQVVSFWNEVLSLPAECFRNHVIDHYPTSSSGRKTSKLPYGVCSLRLCDTRIVQHIYGAIQQYAAFEEPRWLDGRPRSATAPGVETGRPIDS